MEGLPQEPLPVHRRLGAAGLRFSEPWDYLARFLLAVVQVLALVQVLEQHGVLTASEVDGQLGSPPGEAGPQRADAPNHA